MGGSADSIGSRLVLDASVAVTGGTLPVTGSSVVILERNGALGFSTGDQWR